jgi:hypothetical protein
MKASVSSSEFRDQIVGKRISGVIARPGGDGEPPMVMMLRFDDGSVVEFVSPRSDRILEKALRIQGAPDEPAMALESGQFELMAMPALAGSGQPAGF